MSKKCTVLIRIEKKEVDILDRISADLGHCGRSAVIRAAIQRAIMVADGRAKFVLLPPEPMPESEMPVGKE